MEDLDEKFYYVYSSSLEHRIQIKIGTLEGKRQVPEYDKLLAEPMLKFSGLYQEGCSDLYVSCQVLNNERPLALPVITSYKPFTTRWNWNEWIMLPVYFSDLPRSAILALTIYDSAGPEKLMVVGGTSISLFGKHGMFRQGMFDLRVWPGIIGSEATPGKAPDSGKEQMQRLGKLAKKHRNGHITKVDWLDRLTFREIEMINESEKRTSEYMYLMIEFPTVEVEGVHDKTTSELYESECILLDLNVNLVGSKSVLFGRALTSVADSFPLPSVNLKHSVVYYEQDGDEMYQFKVHGDVVTVPDFEILQDNLVESKHHRLARSLRSGVSDKDAKPNASVRDMLNAIVAYPPTKQLSAEELDLVWKFRFYLSSQKKALTKFLKCVNWNSNGEVRQALSLMQVWVPMDVEDALELLTPNFTHPDVRRYAISRLNQAPDEDLMLYLLQLVQALKYESFDEIKEVYKQLSPGRDNSSASSDSDGRIQSSSSKGHSIDKKDSSSSLLSNSDTVKNQTDRLNVEDQSSSGINLITSNNEITGNSIFYSDCTDNVKEEKLNLVSFLIQRACGNSALANYLYWYLLIECEDQNTLIKQDGAVKQMYVNVMKIFSQTLTKGSPGLQKRRSFLVRQQKFIDRLVELVKAVTRESGNRTKKTERLQQLLADTETFKFNFTNFEPIPFPLDPNIYIKGIVAKKASLFKSALMPSKLTFLTTDGTEYQAIFKHGDDLRQDQLILQMITLMDKLLRRENLDLKLTPYKVLATSSKHGFLQFIESVTVAEAVASEGSIHNFFRKYHPCEGAPYGIKPEVMDTYIRSCAGYCVITYLLGVGDRHLDNLLLTTNGALFHIDFGYILGRDPKPLPPPMKLSKEMVEAMGGVNSEHFQEFRKQCYTAFLHLRRHANLMLNLFSLMVDATVPDIALEPDKAVKKVQDKLRLDLGDEEAVHCLQNLLDMSVTAVMAALVEQFHKFAQYWRK